jgi:hypothetical protein
VPAQSVSHREANCEGTGCEEGERKVAKINCRVIIKELIPTLKTSDRCVDTP